MEDIIGLVNRPLISGSRMDSISFAWPETRANVGNVVWSLYSMVFVILRSIV
jgi:hypothetical protein